MRYFESKMEGLFWGDWLKLIRFFHEISLFGLSHEIETPAELGSFRKTPNESFRPFRTNSAFSANPFLLTLYVECLIIKLELPGYNFVQ